MLQFLIVCVEFRREWRRDRILCHSTRFLKLSIYIYIYIYITRGDQTSENQALEDIHFLDGFEVQPRLHVAA